MHVSVFKYTLPNLHKYSPDHRASAEGTLTLFQSFMVSVAVSKVGKTDLDQELK